MTGLISWWPLNEDSGTTAYDLSGNDNHGTLNGGIVQNVAGKGGLTSYSFNGSDGEVEAGNNGFFGNVDWSVSLWVKVDSIPDRIQHVLHWGDGDFSIWWLIHLKDISGDGNYDDLTVHFDEGGNKNTIDVIDSGIDDGRYHHLTVVHRESEGYELFVDRKSTGTTSDTGTLRDNGNNSLYIAGDITGNGRFFDGKISDVRVYNRALSSQEIQTMYDWGNGDYAKPLDSSSPSAVSRWALDGDLTDSWGSYNGVDETSTGYNEGVRGKSKVFDSSQNDYVSVNSGNDFSEDFSAEGTTVSSWVRTAGTGTRKTIWAGNGKNSWWDTRVNENERPEFWYSSSGGNSIITADETLKNSTWYHLTYVCRPSDYRLSIYLNGTRAVSGGNGNTPDTKQFSKNSIGDRSGDEYMDGRINDIRIYSKALSPQEVFELYRYGTRGRDMRKFTVNSRGL